MAKKMPARRAILMMAVVSAAFSAIGVRFWTLQVVRGAHYQALARQDYLRKLPVPSPRGNIVTQDGVTIATSRPSWSLYYLNQGVPLPQAEVRRLSQYLSIPASRIATTVDKALKDLPSYDPIQIATDLSPRQMTLIEENDNALPNLTIRPIPTRYYPYNAVMGNIIGYLGDMTPKQYARLKHEGFSINSLVGKAGLEAAYNTYLHGHSGGVYAEVNSHGQLVRLFGQQVPTPGDTLHLTINWRLEETAQKALAYDMYAMQHANPILSAYSPNANRGGVIAINPNNGDILAMASLPSYNPNRLVPNTPGYNQYIQQVTKNPLDPFLIRPIYSRVSPGSVFKPLMAVAALATKTITPSTEIFDPGYFPKIPTFHNWYRPGFGWLNIKQALGLSDDVFFYTLGYDMGIRVMDHWMNAFLLNKPTGIDLPGEMTSIVPTPQYLKQTQGEAWTAGWNLDTVIGQGLDQFTLIALARADSAIANGGTLYWPHLVSSITTPSGKLVKQYRPVVQGHVPAPAWVFHTVHQGMELSAQDPDIRDHVSGTGYGALAGFPLPLASKTGTAQQGPDKPNNAFFLTYGPMPHPTILVIVYVKNGNWGADSGFVARAIYDQYFKVADPAAQKVFDRTFGRPFPWPFGYHARSSSPPS
jgi:penicillin-binding protein 2